MYARLAGCVLFHGLFARLVRRSKGNGRDQQSPGCPKSIFAPIFNNERCRRSGCAAYSKATLPQQIHTSVCTQQRREAHAFGYRYWSTSTRGRNSLQKKQAFVCRELEQVSLSNTIAVGCFPQHSPHFLQLPRKIVRWVIMIRTTIYKRVFRGVRVSIGGAHFYVNLFHFPFPLLPRWARNCHVKRLQNEWSTLFQCVTATQQFFSFSTVEKHAFRNTKAWQCDLLYFALFPNVSMSSNNWKVMSSWTLTCISPLINV